MRALGEELNQLYHQRDVSPSDEVDTRIAVLRSKMRRGPRLHAGEFLADGKYRLIQRLGKDPGSVRWLAFDRIEGRPVHLSVMYADWVMDDDRVAHFTEKAGALSEWRHPAVAGILDAAMSDEGFVYLATEYFGATSLEQAVRDETVDLTDALQATLEIAAGLQAAHDQGVVHGSVKPTSIVLSDDGGAHLTDFDFVGAPSDSSLYDAPESMQRGATATPQSDVYSLGMTLMFALHKQELPFWVLRDPGRLIEAIEAPDPVRSVLTRAVEWDLDQRWTSATGMIQPILDDASLVQLLGDRALSRGRLSVAAGHFEALLSLEDGDPVALRARLGDLYTRMERFEEARAHLLGALAAATEGDAADTEEAAAPLLELLVQLAAATGEWKEMATGLEELAGTRSGGVAAALYQTAAKIYEDELDDATAAVGAWRGVSEHHQDLPTGQGALEAQRRLAERLGEWGDYVTVSEQLLPYLAVKDRGAVLYAIGRAHLMHLDNEDAGLGWLQRAEEEGHDLVELADRLEEAWASRGAWSRVIDMMAQRAAADGRKAQVSKILLRAGIIATSVRDEELAIRVYNQLLENVPDHTVALRHLARIHHRRRDQKEAEDLFGRLLSSFKGKNPKEPEASERAADYTAWARILLRQGRGDEAEELLQEALRLNPNLVQGLRVAGPLYLDRGEPAKAGEMFDRLLVLYRAVDMSRAKTRACLGNADVAWMQGRLMEAMGWANRALDDDPEEVNGWWGLARSALAARGGHAGADRAPWLMAVPDQFTPQEALARLLAGTLDPKRMIKWLGRSGMGRGLVEGGDSPMRLACAVVDALTRYQLVDPDFFAKLLEVRPEWEGPITHTSQLWFSGELTIPVAHTYAWSQAVIHRDFDPSVERELLAPPPELTGVNNEELRKEEAWKELFGGKKPDAPAEPVEAASASGVDEDEVLPEVTIDGAKGRVVTLWSDSTEAQGRLGRVSVTLKRAGSTVYLEAGKGLELDDSPIQRARIRGGETLSAGNQTAIIRLGAVGADAPIPEPKPDKPSQPPMAEPTVDFEGDEETLLAALDGIDQDSEPTVEPPVDVDSVEDFDRDGFEDAAEDEAPEEAGEAPVEEAEETAAEETAAEETAAEETAAEAPAAEEPAAEEPAAEASDVDASADDSVEEVVKQASEEASADLPGVEADDGGVASFRGADLPPVTPEEEEAEAEAAAEDDEVVRELPGRVVAALPGSPAPVENPTGELADKILKGMTPPPAERQEDKKAGSTIVPQDALAPRVEVMSGGARGTVANVGDKLVIGSADGSGLALSGDSRLAESHCEVVKDGDTFLLRDLGSDAGTVINGQKVKERELEGGEVIMVGRTVLRFLAH